MKQMGNRIYGQKPIYKNYQSPSLFLKTEEKKHNNHIKQSSSTVIQGASLYQKFPSLPIYSFKEKKQYNNTQFAVYQKPDNLTILTYNVWFEQHNVQNRLPCLMKILQDSDADFICLQEVNSAFIKELHSNGQRSWTQQYYVGIYNMHWYDTLILSKFKCKFYRLPFKESYMSRSMVFAELITEKRDNVIVGCMHYESLGPNTQLRMKQLEQTFDICQKSPNAFVVGDFNFSDEFPENKKIPKEYKDAWLYSKSKQEPKWSMPRTMRFDAWRPDHILYKLPKGNQKCQIKLIGKFTIPPFEHEQISMIEKDNIVRTPSDHFGLISHFSL